MAFKSFSQEEFIAKAKSVHGDTYDYSKVTYTGCNDKVIITCRKHGDFEQKPFLHNIGQGCNLCGYEKTKGVRDANRAKALEDGRKTYSGATCKHGHNIRYAKNNACVECSSVQRKQWATNNKDKYKELCKSKASLRCSRRKEASNCLTKEMKEQVKNIYSYARHLTDVYGQDMTVDHVIPLLGENVCGLHVPHNMQIVSKSYNSSKSNRLVIEPNQQRAEDCIMVHESALPWNQKEYTNGTV